MMSTFLDILYFQIKKRSFFINPKNQYIFFYPLILSLLKLKKNLTKLNIKYLSNILNPIKDIKSNQALVNHRNESSNNINLKNAILIKRGSNILRRKYTETVSIARSSTVNL